MEPSHPGGRLGGPETDGGGVAGAHVCFRRTRVSFITDATADVGHVGATLLTNGGLILTPEALVSKDIDPYQQQQ